MNIHSGLFGGVRRVFGARTGCAGGEARKLGKGGCRRPLLTCLDLRGHQRHGSQARAMCRGCLWPVHWSRPVHRPGDESLSGRVVRTRGARVRGGMNIHSAYAPWGWACARAWPAVFAYAAAAAVWTANAVRAVRGACAECDAGVRRLCAAVNGIDRAASLLIERRPVLVELPQPAAGMIRTGICRRKGGYDRRRIRSIPIS